MREIPKEKFDRLPKWAQDEIKSLRREIEDLTDKVETFGGEKRTGLTIGDFHTTLDVPEHWHLTALVDGHPIRVWMRKDHLRIDGERAIVVKPAGGVNVVEVRPWEM